MPTIHNLCGELFPTKIRATANGIVVAIKMVASMINVKIYPIAVETFGFHWVMYFYIVISAFMVTWGGLTIKDTDHLSLTEIQDLNKKTEVSGFWNHMQKQGGIQREGGCLGGKSQSYGSTSGEFPCSQEECSLILEKN